MNENILQSFIEGENYLQNTPLDRESFIKYAEKLGLKITEEELLELERKGLLTPLFKRGFSEEEIDWIRVENNKGVTPRPAYFGLYDGEKEVARFKGSPQIHYASFSEFDKDALMLEIEQGIMVSGKGIEENAFQDNIISYYSSFQIYLLDLYKCGKLKENNSFYKFLQFLIFTQAGFFPYFQSGGRSIRVSGQITEKWQIKFHSIDLSAELIKADLTVNDILDWYQELVRRAMNYLGIEHASSDWLQLWLSISWDKKEDLIGQIRLGVEYLHLAKMVKRILETIHNKEILDVDEITNITAKLILELDTKSTKRPHAFLRDSRNKRYTDGKVNHYNNPFKRLYYLTNAFGLDYQPRLMLFVEGYTEEKVIPTALELFYKRPEYMGIEIVNLGGISEALGGKFSLKNPKDERVIKYVSNFMGLINYNLTRWQIIPYLIGDNENNIWDAITNPEIKKAVIRLEDGSEYFFPSQWKSMWGIDDTNISFGGNSFELTNFTNEEVSIAISEVLGKKVLAKDIKQIREQGMGINKVDGVINSLKVSIADKLVKNLFLEYDKTGDKELLNRPIFKAFEKIVRLASLNHQPSSAEVEKLNREYIKKELESGLN